MRNASLDLLKVGCAVAIFLLHIGFLKNHLPFFSFLINQGLFRVAVPIFAMITGYFFFKIKDSDRLKEWMIRVFILYAFWMLLYSPFWISTDLKDNIINISTGYFILWYLINLIPAGFLLYFINKRSTLNKLGIAIVLYLIGYIIQTLGRVGEYNGFFEWLFNFDPAYRNFLFDLLPMMLIGSRLQEKESQKGNIKPSIFLVLFSLVLIVLESAFNYIWMSHEKSYDLLLTIPFTCSILFLYFKNSITINTENKHDLIAKLATAIFVTQVAAFDISYLIMDYGNRLIHVPLIVYAATMTALFSLIVILLQKKLKFIL